LKFVDHHCLMFLFIINEKIAKKWFTKRKSW